MINNKLKELNFAIAIKIIMIIVGALIITYFIMSETEHSGGGCGNIMSYNEKQMYNSKVRPFLGDVRKGSEVKAMIDTIISMNQSNVGQYGFFISILTAPNDNTGAENCKPIPETTANLSSTGITNWNDGQTLLELCNNANSHDGGDNNAYDVDEATSLMINLKNKINASKSYVVTADYADEIIIRVHIAELDFSN